MRDILIAQRVARKWREVTQGSKQLQQALFMVPREADHAWEVYPDPDDSTRVVNLVKLDKNEVKVKDANGNTRVVRGAELNPMWFTDDDTNVKPHKSWGPREDWSSASRRIWKSHSCAKSLTIRSVRKHRGVRC